MHPDAPFVALLTGVPPRTLPNAVGVVWRGRGAIQIRDLFEWEPAALAEALAISEADLAPLLALRAALPRARVLVGRLAAEGITLVTLRERTYPSALREALGDKAPPALWLAGTRDPLLRGPVAIIGERDAPDEAIAEARALAGIVAREGRSVLTGVATPIERAVLRAALIEPGGAVVGVSHYGIARTMPNLRPWRQAIREGRLLLLSHAHPEASWEPGQEEVGCAVLAGLAERVAVVQGGQPAAADRCAHLALELGRPVFIRENAKQTTGSPAAFALSADGARVLPNPLDAAFLVTLPARRGGNETEPIGSTVVPCEEAASAEKRDIALVIPDTALSEETIPPENVEEMVLRYLTGKRHPARKGALLRALAMDEAILDGALISLIARGSVTQHPHRTGVAYGTASNQGRGSGVFQLSIFGLDQEIDGVSS